MHTTDNLPITEFFNHFENLSITAGIGIMVLDTEGQTLFYSSVYDEADSFLEILYSMLNCEESCRVSLLYGTYQARRFGGRYIFYAPSGLCYCAAPLCDSKGEMTSGVLAGPFLMTDYDDFMDFDIAGSNSLSVRDKQILRQKIISIPCKTPKQIHSLSEHLSYVAAAFYSRVGAAHTIPAQIDLFFRYPIDKEDELLAAISKGDISTAENALNDILKQIMSHYGGNLEVLRSRVVELTVLLSRAALKGGADINEILGLNYDYLREIDNFSTIEDIAMWLQTVARRFTERVFDFPNAKHINIIYKAVDYIKRNYDTKITLRDIANHLFISQSYLSRIFKEGTGQTPGGYITSVRIDESKKLLRDLSVNIADIPEFVGFESQSYFSRKFKMVENCTPGKYRQQNMGRNV